jgi:hypothetical protein
MMRQQLRLRVHCLAKLFQHLSRSDMQVVALAFEQRGVRSR